MKRIVPVMVAILSLALVSAEPGAPADARQESPKQFTVYPIGYVREVEGRTLIEVDKKYLPAMLGVEELSHVWVLWWFDRGILPTGPLPTEQN